VKPQRQQRTLIWLFTLTFLYALLATIVLREVVVPALATTSVGGHLEGDPLYYHQQAQLQLAAIRAHGWVAFELHPQGHGPAGIAGLLYLLWDSPYIVVLLNCLLHALSTVIMAVILRRWFEPRAALIGALPLALSPYMMLWFSQVNKDSYALAGCLLFTWGLIGLLSPRADDTPKSSLLPLLRAMSGVLLIWIVRPYVNQILLPIAALLVFAALMLRIHRLQKGTPAFAGRAAALLLCIGLAGTGAASDKTLKGFDQFSRLVENGRGTLQYLDCYGAIAANHWQKSALLPEFANRKLKAFAGQRCNLLLLLDQQDNPTTLDSFVDADFHPGSAADMLAYLPRAFLLGVFSPWPDKWLYTINERASVFYAITPLETLLAYAGLAGLVFWLWRGGSPGVLVPLLLAMAIMTLYALATPFIGALYRYRYPWWMLLICLGLAALYSLWTSMRADNRSSQAMPQGHG
jgi:putative peptidoglycan lipid II flippase